MTKAQKAVFDAAMKWAAWRDAGDCKSMDERMALNRALEKACAAAKKGKK